MQLKNNIHIYLLAQLLLLTITSCNDNKNNGQNIKINEGDFFEKCRKLALNENNSSQEYSFRIIGKDIQEINVKYLGSILTKCNDTIKFINSIQFIGLYEDSKRANCSIVLYDNKNNYLGKYQVGNTSSMPEKIENSDLVFLYKNYDCDQSTKINFYDSIPKQIFVRCKGEEGDIYQFEK